MLRSPKESQEIEVYHMRSRSSRELEPFKVKMEDIDDAQGEIRSVTLKFAGKPDPKLTKLEQAKGIILAILEEESRLRKDILAILESKSIEERTASQALRDLTKEKLIVVTKSGKENQYLLPPTEAGTDSDTS